MRGSGVLQDLSGLYAEPFRQGIIDHDMVAEGLNVKLVLGRSSELSGNCSRSPTQGMCGRHRRQDTTRSVRQLVYERRGWSQKSDESEQLVTNFAATICVEAKRFRRYLKRGLRERASRTRLQKICRRLPA